ncbi:hypothetical protein QN239_13465 [Mycolicibacterium sp. Y3]
MTISAAILLASCGAHPTAAPPAPTTADTPTSHSAPVPAPAPRTLPWFNLQVGDCVDQIPAVDEGAVDVTLVDCAAPHRAEVYQRAPIPVDAAVTEVANQRCNDALTAYTGASGSYTVSYLIDSNQDRTADNPLPSIVICLLQDAGGGALTRSARGR